MGHARALLTLPVEEQASTARTLVTRGLNVRQAEALVRGMSKKSATGPVRKADADTRRLEQALSQTLGQPVQIRHSARGRGKLVVSYNSLDELDGILSRMGYSET